MRKYYLDNIRWATVVLVLLYHVLYMYNGEGVPGGLGKIAALDVQYYDVYLYAVYPWFMLLLFLVSGICSRYYLERHTDREFVKSRSTKLLVPSTVGLAAFQFIQGWVNLSLNGVSEALRSSPAAVRCVITVLSGVGVLWYVQLLWLFSMLLLPIRRLERDRLWRLDAGAGAAVLLGLAAVIWGAAQLGNVPVVAVYRFGYYGAAFLLGYYVFSHEEAIGVLKKRFPLFLALALGSGIAFCAIYFGSNYADAPVNRTPLFSLFGWFGSLAALGGAARYADLETPFTAWMSRHSFGLYVFHYLGVSSVALFVGRPGTVPAAAVYGLSLIAGFAAGYLLYAVISRLPFFRWAVLGIRKERQGHVSQQSA